MDTFLAVVSNREVRRYDARPLQWSLGGFETSSAVCLWGITAPLGALLFVGARQALPWFVAFIALVAVSAAVDPYAVVATPTRLSAKNATTTPWATSGAVLESARTAAKGSCTTGSCETAGSGAGRSFVTTRA
jgi:hypothetical protein